MLLLEGLTHLKHTLNQIALLFSFKVVGSTHAVSSISVA